MQDTRVLDSGRILPELAFHALMLVALLLLASVGSGKPFWALQPPVMALLLLVSGTYFVAAVGILVAGRRGRVISFAHVLSVGVAAAAPVLALGVALNSGLRPAVVLGAAFRTARPAGIRSGDPPLFVLGAGCRGDGGSRLGGAASAAGRQTRTARQKARAGGAGVAVPLPCIRCRRTTFRNFVPPGTRDQGGITLFGDRYLLTNGDGDLVLFRAERSGRTLEVERLAYKVPINITDFMAAAGTTVNVKWFRVADALAQQTMATCACS